jgi:hypothetical protein
MAVLDVHHPFQMWLSYGLMDGPIEETKPTNNNKHWGQSSHDQSGINPNEEDKINWNEDVNWVWWNLLNNTQKIHGRRKKTLKAMKQTSPWTAWTVCHSQVNGRYIHHDFPSLMYISHCAAHTMWYPPSDVNVGLYPHQLVRYIYHKS